MELQQWSAVLGWCAVINLGLLSWWAAFIVFAHDFVYRLHTRWFRLPVERFDAIHYAGIVAFKLATLTLFVVPWIALKIVS